jgi:protein-tyrosine phosphatase
MHDLLMTTGRIDVHAHLLPGLDDGSTSVAESIEIAGRFVAAGYAHAFCTPHVWPGYEAYTPDFIRERTTLLQMELQRAGIELRVHPGAELNLDWPIETMRASQIPTYGMKGFHALFDFWRSDFPKRYMDRVRHLKSCGITPICAHPERIEAFQDDESLLDTLAKEGVLFQGNLQCLSDPPARVTRELIEKWLREDRYFMLGSDAHRTETMDVRINGLARAEKIVGAEKLDVLTRVNPMTILQKATGGEA